MEIKLGTIKYGREFGHGSKGTKFQFFACPDCGARRWVSIYRLREYKHNGLCHRCVPKAEQRWSGENHFNWRGGRARAEYKLRTIKSDNPYFCMATKRGIVAEHRLVLAEHLGRPLTSAEIAHHLNGMKADNRIENLALVDAHTHPMHTFAKVLQARIRELEAQIDGEKDGT